MLPLAADLPDPLIGLAPYALDEFDCVAEVDSRRPRSIARGQARLPCAVADARTSPKMSSWNWSLAALPMRTGLEPS